MKKIAFILFISMIFCLGNIITIDGFSSPESVIVKDNNVYVSNVGKELRPSLKDGDGFISKLDKNGKVKELKFISGLNAPKGMSIVNNTLFVADIDTIKGFDLKNKKEVFSLVFKGAKFLNDIVVKDDKTLFVSASHSNKIYEVDILSKTYKKLVDFKVPNGLFYEDNILYVAQLGSDTKSKFDGKGKLYKIDLKNNNSITSLSQFHGILDGIYKKGNEVYVSDWVNMKKSGIIRIYNLKTKKESILKTKLFVGSADFWIDEKSNKLYLPEMIGGKLSIIQLK